MRTVTIPLLTLALWFGCGELNVDDAECPCAEGWVCCEDTDVCVAEAAMCTADVGPTPDGAPPGTPDADMDPDPDPDAGISPTAAFTVFLNFEGATVSPGSDDASINRSSVVSSTVTTATFSHAVFSTTKTRAEVIDDIRDGVAGHFAPYDVAIVTDRPASGSYEMVLVGGRPQDIGFPGGVGGVAPFNCDVIPGGVVYVFSDNVGSGTYATQLQRAARWTAQEVAHAYGLEHVELCTDVMTAVACGSASFTDIDATCTNGTCMCGGTTQNAHEMLTARLGPG